MRGELIRHKACGLAIALVATSSLSLLTPSYSSEGSSLAGLVAKNTGLSVVVKAETAPTLALTASDLTVSGDTITGFSASGLVKVNAVTVTGTSIKFPADLTATKIGRSAFSGKFKNKSVIIEFPDNIESIDNGAFATNSAITGIKFNKTTSKLKSIGFKSFYSSGLAGAIEFPDSLASLGNDCFMNNRLTSITLPDNLTDIGGRIFADNEITSADLGKFDKVKSRIWLRDKGNPSKAAKADTPNVIPYGIFMNNRISSLRQIKFPTTVWGIGEAAFENNKFTSLDIPAHIGNIFSNGFKGNKALTRVNFLSKDTDTNFERKKLQIDRGAFQNCAIEGHLEFPAKTSEMGGWSFAGNKITSVDFGPDSPLIGYNAFDGSPVRDVMNLNTWRFEPEALYNTGSLKNVDFDYSAPKDGDSGKFGQTIKNNIGHWGFGKGQLKSLKFPAYIEEMNSQKWGAYNYSPLETFIDNPGWIKGTNKVALYRVASDGATYVTDNALDDSKAKDYIINPVLVKFVAKDQYGNVVTLSSIEVERTRTIKGASEAKTVTSTAVNQTDFKLGDKIKFAIPAAPEGYEIAESPVSNSAITKTADGNYEVTLDPTNAEVVKEVAYGDGYKVGYKETVIEIAYKNLSPEPPKPEVKPENPGTPATPGAIQPEKPGTPGAITPESPSTPATPEAIKPSEPAKPSEPVTPSTPGNPTTPNTPVVPTNPTEPTTPVNPATPTTTIPTENPPTNVPFTPERIVNPNLIPEGNPVFNIVDEDGTSLGNAEVNKDDGTYTFVKDKRTPKGVAKIRKDNTLEVVKVFDGKTPQGKLPRTGGSSEEGLVLLGAAMLGLGAFFRRKIK